MDFMSGLAPPLTVDRKSTRLNSSHTVIYTLSLHDALPICAFPDMVYPADTPGPVLVVIVNRDGFYVGPGTTVNGRSEEHTSELQSHSDLHSFPTRRSSDLCVSRHGISCRHPRSRTCCYRESRWILCRAWHHR